MKPMLLSNEDYELEDLDYINMFILIKRDGVRAELSNEGIHNRSLKKLRNEKVQDWFRPIWSKLPKGVIVEAEITDGVLPCRKIAGICNSSGHDIPEKLKLYVFGIVNDELNFEDRIDELQTVMAKIKSKRFQVVEQFLVPSATAAKHYYDKYIKDGHEGAVLMDGRKMYKHGRVTINQHIGFKIKPHREDDLEIIGVNERFKNTNEKLTNELGRSYRRNTVDAKEPTGIAATFTCKLPNGEECNVTLTGEESFRREIWKNQKKYIGCYAVVKSMDYGVKNKPRNPRLLSIKDKIEK